MLGDRGVDDREMAGKGKGNVRIENEIEKSREESDWKKLIDLAEQLKARSPNHGDYFSILYAGQVPNLTSYLI